jgi:hypothetical protein
MLEACVEMCLKAQFSNYWVVVAVDVGVDSVHSLEYLSNHAREGFWKLNTCLKSGKNRFKL